MTFVIIGGGIDLSVGSLVALCTVWATTVATQDIAAKTHLVGAGAHRPCWSGWAPAW